MGEAAEELKPALLTDIKLAVNILGFIFPWGLSPYTYVKKGNI